METTPLTVITTLPATPKEVFGVLTDSGRHSEATGAESVIDARPGEPFSYFDGAVSGTFERVEPDALIVQRLRATGWPEDHYATVRQELSAAGDAATRVRVFELDVPAAELDAVVAGWHGYWAAIADYLRSRRTDVVTRFVDDYKNNQNPDAVDELVTADCVFHGPIPNLSPDREGLRQNGRLMCAAFPNVHAERKFFVTERDIVVERAEVRATHEGELMGMPATGNEVTWTELHAYRIRDDRIAEVWSEADFAGVMRQIGAGGEAEANKEVIRRLYGEVMARGNTEVADEIFHPDYVDHMPIMKTPDREGLLASVEAARRAFPDVEPRIIAEIANDEWVAIAVEVDGGTQQDTYMGVPASGKPVSWTETHFWRLVDGKIVEHHGNVSLFELHNMIGSHDIDGTLA